MHTRADAWNILTEWTEGASLRRHALAVEACMRWHAKMQGEDEELWGNTGLLHDFDYEKNPDASQHPEVGMKLLREQGWPEELIHAIGGHAQYLNIPRESLLDKTLFAVDELSGLIIAVAYIRPNKTLAEVTPEAVLKYFNKKGFAQGVNRDDVRQGAEELGISLEELMTNCVKALQAAADVLGM